MVIMKKIQLQSWWLNNIFSRRVKYLLLPYLILVATHLLLAHRIEAPWVVPDEFIHLAHARYFAGLPHSIFFQEPYAHFAYGLFIAPSFLLFESLENSYRFIVLLNSFYISSLYILVFLILKKVFKQTDHLALGISLLVNFLPGVFTRAYSAMSENLFIPLFYLVLLLFYLFLEKMSYWRAFFFAFAVGLIYATHYRGLVVVVISIFYLLILYFHKKNKALIFGAVLIILNSIFVNLLNAYLLESFWIEPLKYSATQSFIDLLQVGNLSLFLLSILGQSLYLVIVSLGVFILGAVYFIKKIKIFLFVKSLKLSEDHFNLYASILMLAVFISSTLVTVVSNEIGDFRFDHFFYGRYNEVFLPLLIAVGLIKWSNISRRSYVLFAGVYFLVYIFLYFVIIKYLNHYNYGIINIISLGPIIFNDPPWKFLLFIIVSTAIIFFALSKIQDINKKIILLGLVFIFNPGFYYASSAGVVQPNDRVFINKIAESIKNNKIDRVAYYLPHITESENGKYEGNYRYWHSNYFMLQYYLPKTNIMPLSSVGNLAEVGAVITGCEWQEKKYHKVQQIIIDQSDPTDRFNCMGLYLKNIK